MLAHQSVPVFGGLAGKLRVNDGMPDGVLAVLIDPRVQRRVIVVEDVLVRLGLTVGSHGFGPSAEEGLSGIQGLGPQAQLGILPLLGFPFALPLFNHHVTALTDAFGPLDRARVQHSGHPW